MNDFKVGDWVRNNNNEIFQLDDLHMWQKKDLNSLVKLWQPKEGEWCWFYDIGMRTPQLHQFQCFSENEQLNYGERFVEKGQERDSWGYDYCEPFIGELPSFIKDKQWKIIA